MEFVISGCHLTVIMIHVCLVTERSLERVITSLHSNSVFWRLDFFLISRGAKLVRFFCSLPVHISLTPRDNNRVHRITRGWASRVCG